MKNIQQICKNYYSKFVESPSSQYLAGAKVTENVYIIFVNLLSSNFKGVYVFKYENDEFTYICSPSLENYLKSPDQYHNFLY